jgi:hypothetical protein
VISKQLLRRIRLSVAYEIGPLVWSKRDKDEPNDYLVPRVLYQKELASGPLYMLTPASRLVTYSSK